MGVFSLKKQKETRNIFSLRRQREEGALLRGWCRKQRVNERSSGTPMRETILLVLLVLHVLLALLVYRRDSS